MRSKPLRNNPLATQRAGMLEDRRTVATKVRVECYSVASTPKQVRKRLLAILKRRPTQVLAVELD